MLDPLNQRKQQLRKCLVAFSAPQPARAAKFLIGKTAVGTLGPRPLFSADFLGEICQPTQKITHIEVGLEFGALFLGTRLAQVNFHHLFIHDLGEVNRRLVCTANDKA